MYACEEIVDAQEKIRFPDFAPVELEDKDCFENIVNRYQPVSCEYNFANLFAWQGKYKTLWTVYLNRLLIYDGYAKTFFMPLGKPLSPKELVMLSVQLDQAGFPPVFSICPQSYIDMYPDLSDYFEVKNSREIAEYVYDVDALVELTGVKLHKKRNLVSQFKRKYPDYTVSRLTPGLREKAFSLAQTLYQGYTNPPFSLKHEFLAIQSSFEYFDELELDGVAVLVDERMVAFSVFSRLNRETFDIQFEKSDIQYKGAAQLINQETARYLQDQCRFINREQDLGIKGLRQAKMSYEPFEVIPFYTLKYKK